MRESVRQSSKRLNPARPHRRRPGGQTEMHLAQYEAEQRCRAIFENTSDGIFLHDLETRRLTMCNKSCLQMLGYTEEEFLKLTVADLHPEEDLPFINAQIDIFLQGGTPNRRDIRFKRKDGSIFLADLSPDLVRLDGKSYVVVALKDITERKRMEEELRRHTEHLEELVAARTGELQESERRYRALAENDPDIIQRFDRDLRRLYVNPAFEPATGVPLQTALGKTDRELELPEHLIPFWEQAVRTVFRTGERQIIGFEMPTPRGPRHYEAHLVPEFAPDGSTEHVLAITRDITERVRMEEALRDKEYLLSESQRIGHIGSWSVDLTTYAATWTPETYRLFGVSPDTFVPSADALIGLLHPDDRGAMREWIQAALAGEHPGVLEFRVVLPDGTIRTLNGRGELIFAGGDTPARLVGTAQDVTEQKQAQAALLESEERYRILLEKSFDGIFVHEGFRIVQVNDRLAQMAGYAPSELVGSQEIDLFTPGSQERIRQYIRSGATGYFEIELRRRDGRIVDVESFGAPCTFQGRNARIVGLRDITERKRAQEALRESEERFRAAFEKGAVAMALTALDSTLLKVNSSFCRMLGFSESELVGRSFTEITHPDDIAANLVGTQRLASGEISSFRMEKRYIRKDGVVIWGDMCTASVRDAQGRPLYCVTHVQDVTERKQAEAALRSLNERLELQVAQRTEDLRHTVGRLQQLTLELSQAEDRERHRIADILHDDVQQILVAARFHLNLLSSEPRSAEESQEIVGQVKQMLKDAIEKSRSLSHELSPALYQVELTEILSWLACHMQRKHGLTVHVEAHGPVDSSSEPLKALLYKVAQELLFNVVKHADVNEARIRVRRMGGRICLSVVDRGRGFDSQGLQGATGFGLLSIHERVQLLGGQMKVRSIRGVGTRVLIAVPDEVPSQVIAPPERRDG
jgi:PAS domain S-box-containing protein